MALPRTASTLTMRTPQVFLTSLPSVASDLSDLSLPSPVDAGTPASSPSMLAEDEWDVMTAEIGTTVHATRAAAWLARPPTPAGPGTRWPTASASLPSLGSLQSPHTPRPPPRRRPRPPSVPSAIHRATANLRDLVSRQLSFGTSAGAAPPPAPRPAPPTPADHAAFLASEAATLAAQYAAIKGLQGALGAAEAALARESDWYARRRGAFYARKVALEGRVGVFEARGHRSVRRARSLGRLGEEAALRAELDCLEAEWGSLMAFSGALEAQRRRAAHDADELRIAIAQFCRRRRGYRLLTPTSDAESSPSSTPAAPPRRRGPPPPTLTLLPGDGSPDPPRIANTLAGARRNPRFALTALGDALRQLEAAKRHLATYKRHRGELERAVRRLEAENAALRARVRLSAGREDERAKKRRRASK
ncbi:hypothetical protein Q8F55_007214 [Vanrija albida]|uniref:Up-regulated during septation protein 1 domain-containing protein n=1 Tax=Vanrija albida TaxID=181172 RepID=A0ABR3PZG6_9TREE